uniref:Glycosyltransferase family 92 protein n=1 Tax=Steinernema glaseri TaxID=37863 RepID=A0A1I7YGD4_9BILA
MLITALLIKYFQVEMALLAEGKEKRAFIRSTSRNSLLRSTSRASCRMLSMAYIGRILRLLAYLLLIFLLYSFFLQYFGARYSSLPRVSKPVPALLLSNDVSNTTIVTVDKSNAFLVVNSYFHFVSDNIVGFQAIGFTRCKPQNKSWTLIIGDQAFPLEAEFIQEGCPTKLSCTWVDYRLRANIPDSVDLDQPVYIESNDEFAKVDITVKNPYRRIEGMDVCVAPLYYFNNWIRVIEFVEFYKSNGVFHMYIYVSSASKTVLDLLKYYEKKGVVTVVEWPELPKVDHEVDVRFRLGQHASIHDCVLRSTAKFVVNVDLDDWIYLINSTESLLEYVTRHSLKDPKIGAFQFHQQYARQNPHVGDLSDWKKIDFDGLQEADMCDSCNYHYKSIIVGDAMDTLNPHQASLRKLPDGSGKSYTRFTVPKTVGRDYHVRFAMYKGWDKEELFEKRPLFPKSVGDNIKKTFDKIMEEFSKTHQNLTIPATSEIMQACNPFSKCMNPYTSCSKNMSTIDSWMFASNTGQVIVI